MKVPKALTFPLKITLSDGESIEISDAHGLYVFELYPRCDEISKGDRKLANWIVKVLNKAANDS